MKLRKSTRWLSVAPFAVLALAMIVLVAETTWARQFDQHQLSSLKVLNRVVLLVKEQYVEPDRIEPREMFVAALESVEKRVPEVLVEEPKGATIGVSVGDARREFFVNDFTSLWELSFKLRDVFRFLEGHVAADFDQREIEYAAVNGMLSKLDPHSVLLEPRYSKEMKLSTKGEFGGLGIVISIRDGYLTVISPIEGTPADKAGIQAQDRIVKIGEESTINMGLDEAVERLRGKPGTEVIIWVQRKGLDEPKRVPITRAIIRVDSVSHQLLDNDVGYVKIKQFSGSTSEDVALGVEKMRRDAGGDLSGLILDLRNNPGGLLDQSVEVSNLFLEDGVIVVTQEGGAHGERKEIKAMRRPDKIGVPLVVLVNGGSASASEIVSGAVKNRERGIIVGDQTFGKGSVQQLYDFPDGSSLKLTIGQYLTPGDESIQSVGITPDVRTRAVLIEDAESINLFPDDETREEDLARHLDDDRIVKRRSKYKLDYLEEPLDDDERERRANSSKFHDDFEIAFARRVLALTKGPARDQMLAAAGQAVDETRRQQMDKISTALAKVGVDWSAGATPAAPKLKVDVINAAQGKAGTASTVELAVTNEGAAPVFRLKGISKSTNPLFADREFLFGKLGPGERRTFKTKVALPKNLSGRHDLMRVELTDDDAKQLAAIDVPIEMQGLDRPRFAYALFIDDTAKGNGDGLLQEGEEVQLVVSIRNAGPGVAEKPMALLKNLSGPALFIEKGRQQLTELKSGGSTLARFSFQVKKPVKEAELRLQVFDGVLGDYLLEKLKFPVFASGERAKPRGGVVKVSQKDVRVLAAADARSAVLAKAEPGAKLRALASVGEYVRVKVGDLHGFVPSADVGPSSGRVATDTQGIPKGLSQVFGRDPPRVQFQGVAGDYVVVDGDSYTLNVRVTDDGPVHDVYIFNNDEKVFYKKLDSKERTDEVVRATVQLEPGVNTLTVIAREDDEFAQREALEVFSKRGDPLAKKPIVRH